MAEQLPLQLRGELLAAARRLYNGMIFSAAIAAAAMVAVAAMVLIWLRAVQPSSAASH